MTTALAYIRRSVVRANKPTLSPQRQQDTIADYCRERGWEMESYADAEGHRSGRSEKGRPEWLRLKQRIQLAAPGEIAAVLVYQLDRSARSTRDFLNFLQLLQEKKVDFVSVTQPFLDTTTSMGRAFITQMMVWAELEANIDSERVTADIAYRQQNGYFVGHCPIGYRRELVDGQRIPVPDPEVAPKIVRAWEEYATGKHSYHSLARWINNILQLPTAGGGPWTHKHVQIMLENWQVYTGNVTRHKKRGGTEVYPGRHQAIISQELAERVQAVRQQRQNANLMHRTTKAKDIYLLSSRLYCASCGAQLRGRSSHGERVYQHPKRGCTYSIVNAERIEQAVLNYYRGWQIPDGLEKRLEDSARERVRQAQTTDDQGKQIAKLRQRKERALRLFEMGQREENWLTDTLAEIDHALKALQPQITLSYSPAEMCQLIRGFHDLLGDSQMPREMVRNLLSIILTRVEVTKAGTINTMIPAPWFDEFYVDLGNLRYPQGTLTSYQVAAQRLLAIAKTNSPR